MRAIPLLAMAALCAAVPLRAAQLSDPSLVLTPHITGLSNPTGLRFIGPGQAFLIEKDTGQVKLWNMGAVSTVLDLNVQNDSERGLLGIALDPAFGTNGFVYLYHSTTSAAGDSGSTNQWQANQLTRYTWNGTSLTSPALLRTFGATDPGQANGPNHNGGPLVFGADGKVYGTTGDLNRSRSEQNAGGVLSADVGGLYRLNPDGSAPADNPFAAPFDEWRAYGVRNSFGLAFDPVNGNLWDTENGPNAYDEINLVPPAFNSGWTAIMGPDDRNTQNAPGDLVMLPNAVYSDPEFSFLDPIGITSIGFLAGSVLGPTYDNGVLIGNGRFDNGRIYILRLNGARTGFDLAGDLADGVADSAAEANTLTFGQGFGVVTDIQVGPDNAVYVVSLNQGMVYRIAPIPEPGPAVLFVSGLLVLAIRWRRLGKAR